MGNLRNSKGVTLLVLTITIIVLLIITSITIGNVKNQLGKKNLNNLYSDIEAINAKISEYYLKNNSLPIFEENSYISGSSQLKLLLKTNGGKGTLVNANDESSYYVINLSKLENLTLNYGREYSRWDNNSTYEKYQDLYIINEVTHQVYYPKGVKYNGRSYFTTTIPEEIDKIQSSEIADDGFELIVNGANKNYVSGSNTFIIDADVTVNIGSNFTRNSLQYGWNVTQDGKNIDYTKFELDSSNSAKLMSRNMEDSNEYYLYVKTLDVNGNEHVLEEKIDEFKAEISNKGNYATYTVTKNGIYTFSSTDGETKYYNTINQRGTKTKFTNVTGVANQYVTDFNNMVTSVDKYKGFYIGRYEMTGSEEKGEEKRGKGFTTPLTWYQQYNSCMTFDNNYVTGGMIYGSLWDTALQWLAKSGYNVGYTGEPKSGYGNYFNEEVFTKNDNTKIIVKQSKSSVQLETGQVSYTKSNNIYDLAGNAIEWTQTANAAMFRARLRRYMFRKLWR